MVRGFNAEVRRIIVFASICILFGLINGHIAWTLIVGGTLYMAWVFWQIRQLDLWLSATSSDTVRRPPPDASGIWGDIFDNIYRLQKRQKAEQRQMLAVVNRVQDTTSALRDGIILLDSRGNMEWWNRAAQRLLGFQSTDQGQALVNFVRHPRFVSYFEAGKYTDMIELASPRNRAKRLQFQINHAGNNGRLVVVRDVTRLYKLEQMRQDFVANVSHEMRTPLTVVRGYLETMVDSGQLPEKWQAAFNQMEQQTQRMSLLVNDLITLSKLETDEGDQSLAQVEIAPMLTAILNEAKAFSGDKHQHFTLDCPKSTQLKGSEKELHSAFSNLVFNAVKYTPAGGEIHVGYTLDTKGAHLSVTDNGIGIEPRHIPRLTERFYRVEASRNSATGGTGLGLAIVKHVLLRHDAQLSIQSKPGHGSTFTCNFPPTRVVESIVEPVSEADPAHQG